MTCRGLEDADVVRAMEQLRSQQTGSTFMPITCRRIVAISVVLSTSDSLRVWSLGSPESGEKELLKRFLLAWKSTTRRWSPGTAAALICR